MTSAYQQLESRFHRINALGEAAGVLGWDMAAMMPEGGAVARTEQLVVLAAVRHDLLTAAEVGDWLAAAEDDAQNLSLWQGANLREMRRIWQHATALDSAFVTRMTRACKTCEGLWRTARPDDDFKAVLPALRTVLELSREEATIKSEIFGCSPYDALLDSYEPGGSSAQIDVIFDDYVAFFPDFLGHVMEAQGAEPAPPCGPFPVEKQVALGREMMAVVGFDFKHGRLDRSLHPFCGGVPDDVRLTTRYDEENFLTALLGVLHETGHAMYDRGLPTDWRLQPVGAPRGMVLHESQSLLLEMQACRSAEFIAVLAGKVRDILGVSGPTYEAENLLALNNRVAPGFIRLDADEITYPAHVILRYRLERALIEGRMDADDLPMAWNDGMDDLLGLRPPCDRLGCLQDIHWYDGAWGYFPTYSLGAMAAAQIFDAAHRANPDLLSQIGQGNFAPLMAWLGREIHSQASVMSTDALLQQATGRSLDPSIFQAHLKARYLNA